MASLSSEVQRCCSVTHSSGVSVSTSHDQDMNYVPMCILDCGVQGCCAFSCGFVDLNLSLNQQLNNLPMPFLSSDVQRCCFIMPSGLAFVRTAINQQSNNFGMAIICCHEQRRDLLTSWSPVSGASLKAPASSSSRVGSMCPFAAAWCSRVMPSAVKLGLRGRWSNSSSTIESLSLQADIICSYSLDSGRSKFQQQQLDFDSLGKHLIIWNFLEPIFRQEPLPKSWHSDLSCHRFC